MRVGILGGGQLAQMMAQAGTGLDCSFAFLDPSPTACAFPLGEAIQGAYDDPRLLKKLAQASDAVTFEFENVPHSSVEVLSEYVKIFPPARALEISQDRLKEKKAFLLLSIPTTRFIQVDHIDNLRDGVRQLGFPCVLKTRSQGYDGKGQRVLRSNADVESAWNELGNRPLILEEFISFEREVSIIAVRNRKGKTECYDLCENEHSEGILRFTRNRPNDPMHEKAKAYVNKLLDHMNYVGVLTLELFQKDDELLANEMAPRVHNSGHWTIEGAETSQFENHLRAVLDMPLGSTKSKHFSTMANLIGNVPNSLKSTREKDLYVHIYGKEPRPGRKLGHITACYKNDKIRTNGFENLRKMTLTSESDL